MKTITVDAMLANRAKEEGVNLSRTMDKALEAMFAIDDSSDGPTPEQLAAAAESARSNKIGEAIAATASSDATARESALSELQSVWNLYIRNGTKPVETKLTWVRAHRDRKPALQGMTPEAILAELEGSAE